MICEVAKGCQHPPKYALYLQAPNGSFYKRSNVCLYCQTKIARILNNNNFEHKFLALDERLKPFE